MKTIKLSLLITFLFSAGLFAAENTAKPIKTLQFKTVTPRPEQILWRKTYDTNLRTVELRKVRETTEITTEKEVYSGRTLTSSDIIAESVISKTLYKLALIGSNGNVEKVYDLSKLPKMKMIATAYYAGDPLAWRDGTITYLGAKMERGIIAVDPKVIPLRTRLYVSGYGYGYAGDTGSAIKGNRIDLGVNNAQEEQAWMFRPVTVYILERHKKY
jgi:3D (Asp-Asp-Asp) domain-containing protein